MNSSIVTGRLVKKAEIKNTSGSGTAVTNFTLAVKNPYKQDKCNYIPVVVWGKQAEALVKYTDKGSKISVRGRLESRTYEAAAGDKVFALELIAEKVEYLDSKPNNSVNNSDASKQDGYGSGGFDDDMTPIDDGDIPF